MKPALPRMLSNFPLLSVLRRTSAAKGGTVKGQGKIEDIAWPEFEQLVIEAFVRRGYQLAGGSRAAATGGDLLLHHDRETYLVHCKDWDSRRVDADALQALHRAMLARGAQGAIAVTFGRYAREATRFAAGKHIQLLDGPALKALIEPVRAARRTAPLPEPVAAAKPRAVPDSPACPLCTKPMRLRTAKRGSHAGHGFWACTGHPHCKGLLALA